MGERGVILYWPVKLSRKDQELFQYVSTVDNVTFR